MERQRTRLLELSASGLEGFRASAETLLQKLRDEAQSSLATLVERVDEDHGNRIRTRSEELSATWIDQLQRQAQETTLKLQEQMEARSRTVAQQDEAVKQQFEYLEARAQAALDSINRWFEERCLQMQALTEEDIRACLAYAAERERRVLTASQ